MTSKKEEIIEFLEAELKAREKEYFLNEAQYRHATAMSIGSKPDIKVQEAQTKTSQNKKFLENYIRQLRGVIGEIKDGKLDI